uniref:Uncharacterized protein n=1 Tax=Oryza nivara TaxID=4536 RepID=A0A0E0IMJ8_ORYNI
VAASSPRFHRAPPPLTLPPRAASSPRFHRAPPPLPLPRSSPSTGRRHLLLHQIRRAPPPRSPSTAPRFPLCLGEILPPPPHLPPSRRRRRVQSSKLQARWFPEPEKVCFDLGRRRPCCPVSRQP